MKNYFFKNLIISAIICLLLSCTDSNPNDFKQLDKYLKSFGYSIENYNSILVLKNTDCQYCKIDFRDLIQENVNKKNVLIIIEDYSLDISQIIDGQNVITETEKDFSKLNLLDYSGAIFIENNKIDTCVSIYAETKTENLMYIREKLSEREFKKND